MCPSQSLDIRADDDVRNHWLHFVDTVKIRNCAFYDLHYREHLVLEEAIARTYLQLFMI